MDIVFLTLIGRWGKEIEGARCGERNYDLSCDTLSNNRVDLLQRIAEEQIRSWGMQANYDSGWWLTKAACERLGWSFRRIEQGMAFNLHVSWGHDLTAQQAIEAFQGILEDVVLH
tara:strand:- start:30 stop:374 length:345 start_codon:yes stop_codon:yes gene_type:complete